MFVEEVVEKGLPKKMDYCWDCFSNIDYYCF